MPRKILIVPDKFKGTLTARSAAEAIARGWRRVRPGDTLVLLPLTDGGDGFGEVMGGLLDAKVQVAKILDAAHRPRTARWWWEPGTRTAVIESANAIGLALLPPKKFHPFELDTFGLGRLIRAAAAKGADRCLIGLGGSATNDGGFGLARALGWKFFDRNGNPIVRWTELERLDRIVAPRRRRWFKEIVAAVDVQNPLLGVRGATQVFGPQKGLKRAELAVAEQQLQTLARKFRRQFGRDFTRMAGAGAAGGLGFGLLSFSGARLKSGFDLFARHAQLDRRLRAADLVITGEGKIDVSTLMGKGVGQIARRCRETGIPCLALAGDVEGGTMVKSVFARTGALAELAGAAGAKARAGYWLERLAEELGRRGELLVES